MAQMNEHADSPKERITKVQAAERQLATAIKLFFGNGDSISVYSLASAAREIVTTLCQKKPIRSFLDEMLSAHPQLDQVELRRIVNKNRAFFKHADSDPDGEIDDFSDEENDAILFIACYDFGMLCGGMPIEMQVYQAWYFACQPGGPPQFEDGLSQLFPGITSQPRYIRKKQGQDAMHWARQQPSLQMSYSRK